MTPLLCAFVFCLQEPSPHEQKAFDIRARALFPAVYGELLATDESIEGDARDVRGDLGIDPANVAGEIEASAMVIPWLTVRARYWQALFHGSVDNAEDFFFGGSFYGEGTRVDSSLEVMAGSLLADFNVVLVETPDIRFELGVLGGLEGLFLEAELTNAFSSPKFTERERFFSVAPQVGLRARAEFFDRVAVELWVHGGGLAGIRDARFLALEGGAEIQVRVVWGVYLTAGWRLFYADVLLEASDTERVEFDLLVSGPMVGAAVRF